MEQLLELARRAVDQAEVYEEDRVSDGVSFQNGKLKDIESRRRYGVGLTVVKDARLGYAYTRNVHDRQGLVDDALASLVGGVASGHELPGIRPESRLDTYDAAIEALDTAELVRDCERVCAHVRHRSDGELDVEASREVTRVRVLNSRGFDQSSRASTGLSYAGLRFPGSYASIVRISVAKGFEPLDETQLDEMCDLHTRAGREVRVEPGKRRVLFLPEAMHTLLWRLKMATGGRAVYERVSPLTDRIGQQLFDERITVEDRPLDESLPGARAFDDEGTPCDNRAIVDRGVLRGFAFDRYYAWRAGERPTGNGYRSGIDHRPHPELRHLTVATGPYSFADLLEAMGTGVVVAGAMGAHSGNILNGDFSIGLSPGLYVEGGEIVGRVKDAMIAGNVYETMRNVIGVADRRYPGAAGWSPAIAFEDVSFAVRG